MISIVKTVALDLSLRLGYSIRKMHPISAVDTYGYQELLLISPEFAVHDSRYATY